MHRLVNSDSSSNNNNDNSNNNNNNNNTAITANTNKSNNNSNNYNHNNAIMMKKIMIIKIKSGCALKEIKSSYIYCSPHFFFCGKGPLTLC